MSATKMPPKAIEISLRSQSLAVIEKGILRARYPISTGKNGVGNEEGSGKTPLGKHLICEKIGAQAPWGAIFKAREWTGECWKKGTDGPDNLILSRILRLQGLEEGINKGPGIDTYDRYIYIHGTNREEAVGVMPTSAGCITLTNDDMIALFDLVEEGTHVTIHQ